MWKNNQQEAFGRNNSPSTDAVAVALVHTKLIVLNKEATHPYNNKMSCHSLCSTERQDALILIVWDSVDLNNLNLPMILRKWYFIHDTH